MADKARRKTKGNFRFLDLFIIVFFLCVTVISLYLFRLDLLNTFSLQNVEPVGTVIIKKNTVQRRLNDRVVWDTLNNESPVYVGDIIRVAEVSSAMLNIQDNSLDIEENSLIRISLSPDGESLQISVDSGTLAIHAGEGSKNVVVNIDGQDIKPEKGTVLQAVKPENGQASTKVYESTEQFIKEAPLRIIPKPGLLSPIAGSIFRYQSENPNLNFRWSEIEEASSYFLQVSNSQDFRNLRINQKISTTSVLLDDLGQGTWYWRVMLDLPPLYSATPVFSDVVKFSIEQTTSETVEPARNTSIAQWLELEAPVITPPPAPPPVPAPAPTPPPAPPPPTPPPVTLLTAPQNLQPAQRTTYGFTQLQSQRSIVFSWSAVQGANAYVFTLYQQGANNSRRQILSTTITNGVRYTLDNLRLLDKGTFIWQVEAVRTGRGNNIERHGRVAESSFIIDFPAPTPIQIEDPRNLYGNEQ